MQGKDLPPDVVIINATEDQLTLDGKRKLLSKTGATTSGQEDAFIKRAKEGMDTQEEATFAVEAPINQQVSCRSQIAFSSYTYFLTSYLFLDVMRTYHEHLISMCWHQES